MTNTELLKKKIDESGLKISFIAEKMGLSRQGLYYKINGEREFTQSEIILICDILKIKSKPERDLIFFKKD